ncbi:MAG: hypothetical protein A2046_04165 [Bacteroidetes bacterium GWA2_30_7]|nr:MAG: hypothetical protein A2046_04165 [Bacteroidetes bacterium GWA2_30_7]
MKKFTTVVFSLLLFVSVVFSQKYQPKTASLNLCNNANEMYQMGNLHGASLALISAIEADSLYAKPYQLLAKIYYELEELGKMRQVYKDLLRVYPEDYPDSYYYIATIDFKTKSYDSAVFYYNKVIASTKAEEKLKKYSAQLLKKVEFIVNAIKNPVPFNPVNLGSKINSELDEYLPSLTIDEDMLVLTVQVPKENFEGGSMFQEDFFVSKKANNIWEAKQKIEGKVNTKNNEGAQSISSDGKFLYFSACERNDGYGECDIYYSEKTETGWSTAKNIGQKINSGYWEAQPSISPDGTELYFASTRPGGEGVTDIWVTKKDSLGNWDFPVNLGKNINTDAVEQFPFIHTDNQTLYFGSEGHAGMGGADLFYSRRDSNWRWSKPVNLGYPINTEGDELSLIVNAKGDIAYFASDRKGGFGKQDIYMFELYGNARPVPVTYLKGRVFDFETKEPLSADFELIELENDKVVMSSISDSKNGEFIVCIPVNKNYALNVSKNGYMFYSDNFSLSNINKPGKPYLKDIPLHKVKEGETVVLKNIFFKTNSYELLPESISELNKLINFMNYYPDMKIEVSGHTDNTGKIELNTKLSENRAKSVYDYLIKKNISTQRLEFKGYADTKPIASNTTPDGKAQNRRTEFKIISLK